METFLLVLSCALSLAVLGVVLLRRPGGGEGDAAVHAETAERVLRLAEQVSALEGRLRDELRRTEKATLDAGVALRDEQRLAAAALRDEQRQGMTTLRTELDGKLAEQLRSTMERLEAIRKVLDQQLTQVRETTHAQLTKLGEDNQRKLDEMRGVVDEKLQATLQTRLGEAFKQVSERLEQLHKGLGEMQSIASEVGGLKRVLSNVKTRGILGEVQLKTILGDMLSPEQWVENVETAPGSNKRVEFAVRMPGQDQDHPVLLPIDAKFPKDDYERLLDALDRGDGDAARQARTALATRMHGCAKDIRDKYIDPPNTTDFALLFLPTEGLYAEALSQPSLAEELQHSYRVMIAGPTTLAALLQSLQMGFRTLALEKRSSDVWTLLSAVKTEFAKYGDVLKKARKQLEAASNTLDATDVRTRAIVRKLRDVHEMPADQAALLLPPAAASEPDDAGADDEDPV